MKISDRVTMWTGDHGTIAYVTPDGWYGVRDAKNPARIDEWQGFQLTPAK